MKAFALSLLVATFLFLPAAASANENSKQFVVSRGKERSYFQFLPKTLKADTPAPVIILLHGSGSDGKGMISPWERLARQEGIVLAAPNSDDPAMWNPPGDGPDFLRDVVDSVSKQVSIDPRRVYLFGWSGGACFALVMAMLESRYFAATAIFAGAFGPANINAVEQAKRKIPVSIAVGMDDSYFSLKMVRDTRDAMVAKGIPVVLEEMPRQNHDYLTVAARVNRKAWEFMQKNPLPEDPKYDTYNFGS